MKVARLHRLQLTAEWYSIVPDNELQEPYDVLSHIRLYDSLGPADRALAAAVFLSLTETLLEKYGGPFRGGEEWDGRKQLKEEWR